MNVVRFPWSRVVWILVIVCAWAPFKVLWEVNLEKQQDELRYHGVQMTRSLRDQLSQGLTIGILAGFRNIVADFVWLEVGAAWEKNEWFKMDSLINLVTSLEPRSILFWDNGAWQLAWNVSIFVADDVVHQPNQLRRLHDSRFWIYRGLEVYKRGIATNPESFQLWKSTGDLYLNRLGDYYNAAYCYGKASQMPGAPIYLERFPAIMMGDRYAHDDWKAYEAWKELWFKLTPDQREEKQHWKEKIISNIQQLEKRLNVPQEKRVFPN